MSMLGLHTNLSNMASAQWDGFNFKSVCQLNGVCLGANTDGIFVLGSSDTDQYIDADNTGSEIDAYFELPKTDLGISNSKHIRSGYVGHESDGELRVTIKLDDEATGFTDSMSPEGTENKQRSGEIRGRRDHYGRYFTTKVQNTNGCDFSVDSIEVIPVILGRKPSGS